MRDLSLASKHGYLFCNAHGVPNSFVQQIFFVQLTFKAYKNIQKLIVLFSSLCADFGIRCKFLLETLSQCLH